MPKVIEFADLLVPPTIRWPTHGDRLFVRPDSPGPDADAEIHADPFSRFVFMMDGYKLAADNLVTAAMEDRIARHDLIYPILFCYRQFLELSLKWQIATYGTSCGVAKPGNGHDLKTLLKCFRNVCHQYGASDNRALAVVSKCVLEFDRMDPNSFTFRYPADKRGDPYPVVTDRIDLTRLKDVMDGIYAYFRGCDGYFDAMQGAQPGY